jgi:CO dehydrogenase maturation factor
MKLVICGKGGSGKSTVVALLAHEYAKQGRRVLVVDTDESNAGLHRLLGIEAPHDLMEFFGGKKGMMAALRESRENNTSSPLEGAKDLANIPGAYLAKKDGISLVAIGKIHHAGEGCACPMGVLAKQFIAGLEPAPDEIVIIDTEAGIEHFGRGIDKVCNVILMVIDPSFESLNLARMVSGMAGTIDVPHFYVLNKTDAGTARTLNDMLPDHDRVLGVISQDPSLLAAGLDGCELPAGYPAASAIIERLGAKAGSS